jgi:hypothetical protein
VAGKPATQLKIIAQNTSSAGQRTPCRDGLYLFRPEETEPVGKWFKHEAKFASSDMITFRAKRNTIDPISEEELRHHHSARQCCKANERHVG